MRPFRLPPWPILILLAALIGGPLAAPARAAPLPVPMAAGEAAPAATVQTARWHYRRHHWHYRRHWHRHYHWRRHYWHRRHHWHRPHWRRRHVYFY